MSLIQKQLSSYSSRIGTNSLNYLIWIIYHYDILFQNSKNSTSVSWLTMSWPTLLIAIIMWANEGHCQHLLMIQLLYNFFPNQAIIYTIRIFGLLAILLVRHVWESEIQRLSVRPKIKICHNKNSRGYYYQKRWPPPTVFCFCYGKPFFNAVQCYCVLHTYMLNWISFWVTLLVFQTS